MSIGREPKSSPPGSDNRTEPQRPISGPSTLIDARIRSTSSYGATGTSRPSLMSRIAPPPSTTVRTPIAPSSSLMIATSAMSGTLVSRYSPSASSDAAISFRTEFFAPGTVISPSSGDERRTMMRGSSGDVGTGGHAITLAARAADSPPCGSHLGCERTRAGDAPARRARAGGARRRPVRAARRPVQRVRARGARERRREHARRHHDVPHRDPVVLVGVRAAGALAPPPSRRGSRTAAELGASGSPGGAPGDRARAARRGIALVRVREHAVHPDGQLRCGRLRDREGSAGRRRGDRALRHRDRAAVRGARRSGRASAGDGAPRVARADRCGGRRARAELLGAHRVPGGRSATRDRPRPADRGGSHRGDAAQQPGLRGQRPRDGERSRRGHRGHVAAAGGPRHGRVASGVRAVARAGCSSPGTCRDGSARRRGSTPSTALATHRPRPRRSATRTCGDGAWSPSRPCRCSPTCSSRPPRSSRTATSTRYVATPASGSRSSRCAPRRRRRSGSSSAAGSPTSQAGAVCSPSRCR